MKKILVTIGALIGFVIAVWNAFGDLFTAINFAHIIEPTITSNATDMVDKASRFVSDYIISTVYWTIGISLVSSILAIFGIKIKSSS